MVVQSGSVERWFLATVGTGSRDGRARRTTEGHFQTAERQSGFDQPAWVIASAEGWNREFEWNARTPETAGMSMPEGYLQPGGSHGWNSSEHGASPHPVSK